MSVEVEVICPRCCFTSRANLTHEGAEALMKYDKMKTLLKERDEELKRVKNLLKKVMANYVSQQIHFADLLRAKKEVEP